MVNKMIDYAAVPFIPPGLRIERHAEGGRILTWKELNLQPSFLKEQLRCGGITGNRILQMHLLEGLSVANANVLDFLLKNPRFIRKEWHGMVFMDPIFVIPGDGSFHVRQLFRETSGRYHDELLWLDVGMCELHPIATLGEAKVLH